MTGVPATIEEAERRQNTILGGAGAMGFGKPVYKPEPGPKTLGDAMKSRQARRRRAQAKIEA